MLRYPDTPGSGAGGAPPAEKEKVSRPRKKEPSHVEQKNEAGHWCQPSAPSLHTPFKSAAAAKSAIGLVVKTGEEYRIIKISEPSLKARTAITLG